MYRTMRYFLLLFCLTIAMGLKAQINLNQGLVAYYPFSGNANDMSGNGNNAVFNNATLTTDKFGNPNSAYQFNGIDNFIRIPNSNSLNPAMITLVAMVKPMGFYQGVCHGNVLINKGDNDFNLQSRYRLRFDENIYTMGQQCSNPVVDTLHQNFYGDFGGNPSIPNYYTPFVEKNKWFCVVYTFDGTKASLYIDGAQIGSITTSIPYVPSSDDLFLGRLNDPQYPYWFNGVMDEVRIYNRALNQQEINSLCNTPNNFCTGSLGDPVVNITFGAGNNPAQPLPTLIPGATTTLGYVAVSGNPATPTPIDGEYTISNNVPFNFAWHSGMSDHTPNDVNGYLAFYNSQELAGLEFYKQSVNNLCGSTTYEFAAWVANCLNPQFLDGVDPDITFRIEKPDGTLLAFYNTGPISESSVFTWKQYGFYFTMPPNESSIVLKMINNAVGGTALPGNDLAIDDITFRPCGPNSDASFSNTSSVDTVITCAGSPVTLYGSLSPGFITPNHRWQLSTDDGQSWTDIPAANTLQLAFTPTATNGKYYRYRMASGDGNNINSLNCRIVTNTLYMLVNELPLGGIKADTVCKGTNGQLLFTATKGTAPFTLTYTDPGNISYVIPNITSGSGFPTPAVINSNTTYTLVSLKDVNGCISTTGLSPQQATVGVKIGIFTAPPNKTVCESQPVQLTGNNGTGYTYSWSPSTFLSDPTAANPTCTPTSTITYRVLIKEPVCSYDSSFSVIVTANPNPIVSAQKSNDIDCSISTAILQASGAETYIWTPAATLSNATVPNPVASPGVTTTYFLTGKNSFGCIDTTSVTIKVTNGGLPIFALPNAFTPNGDGKNDCFGIQKWGNVTITEFSIFNRWGEKVFQTKNPSQCWDGRFKGILQPSGGYTYVILANTFCGKIRKTGYVLLIR